MRLAGSLALSLVAAAAIAQPHAQSGDQAASALVERASRYVEDYLEAFSAVVCEERQVQTLVKPDGRVSKRRELRSDFLLAKIETVWMQEFRDVLEVDGREVRNRDDRLRKLFLESSKTAVEQARAIARESGRYNIGITRNGNSPLLPLRILSPRIASGFRFTLSGASLAFEEFRTPSLLRRTTSKDSINLMSKGAFEVDTGTGRVLAAELTASGSPPAHSFSISVRYAEDPQLKLLVPVEVREKYWRPDRPRDDRLDAVASYSNYRRFTVTVDESIKVPKLSAQIDTPADPRDRLRLRL